MRKMSALLFSTFLCYLLLVVFFPQRTYAQALAQQDQNLAVSTKDTFPIDIIGLQKSKYYRLELGTGNVNDRFLQYNIYTRGNPLCDTNLNLDNEPYVNKQAITNLQCVEENGNIHLTATLDFSKISDPPLLGAASLRVKTGETDGDTKSQVNFTFSVPSISLMAFNNATSYPYADPGITAGTPLLATVNQLLPNKKYRLILKRADGQYSTRSTVTFETTATNCSSISSGGAFTLNGCNVEGNFLKAEVSINTNGYRCNPGGDPAQFHQCDLVLFLGDSTDWVTYTSFKVSSSEVTLKLSKESIYEKDPFTATITGCPSGTDEIAFWYANSENGLTADGFVSMVKDDNEDQGRDTPRLRKISFGTETQKDITFGDEYREKRLMLIGTCYPSKVVTDIKFITVGRIGGGRETIIFLTNPIHNGEEWELKLTNLNHADSRCYYIRVQEESGDFLDGGIPADCDDKIDDKPYMYGFTATSPEMTIKMPEIQEGIYNIYLIKNEDRSWTEELARSVLVGTGAGIGIVIGAPTFLLAAAGGTVGAIMGDKLADAVTTMSDETVVASTFCVGGACEGLLSGADTIPCLYGYTKEQIDENGQIKSGEQPINLLEKYPQPDQIEQRAEEQKNFVRCAGTPSPFGILSTEPGQLVSVILRVFLSISGGIILLLVLRSGYQLLFSQGNPEQVKEARDRLTSAFIGFLFLLFALVILETIGVDILHIPGLNS